MISPHRAEQVRNWAVNLQRAEPNRPSSTAQPSRGRRDG
jgi:hypothetical protein